MSGAAVNYRIVEMQVLCHEDDVVEVTEGMFNLAVHDSSCGAVGSTRTLSEGDVEDWREIIEDREEQEA